MQERLAQHALGEVRRSAVLAGLRLAVGGEVLESGDDVLLVPERRVALESAHSGDPHAGDQIGVLSECLLDPSPPGLAHHVHDRGQRLVRSSRPRFKSRCREKRFHEFRIERSCKRNGLREACALDGRVTVQTFFVENHGDSETRVFDEKLLDRIGEFRHVSGFLARTGVAGAAHLAGRVSLFECNLGFLKIEVTLCIPNNVNLAGTGFIGPAHLEALRRNNIKIAGLAEATPELAQKKAAELGIEHAYPSLEAMLADPKVTSVHLATPNYLHYSQAKAALLAGKHVVCEKPMAMISQESAELVKLAAELNRVTAVNFNLRFYPVVQQARAMVQSGELGSLYILQGSYLQDWLLLPTDWNWRLVPEVGGTLRAVADIGSHWLDLMTFITGLRIEEVFADFKTFLPIRKRPAKPVETYSGKLLQPEDYVDQPIYTEDYASILIHYENGVHGVLTVAQVCAGRKNRLYFEIDGAKSSMAWDSEHPNDLWLGHRETPNGILMKDPALVAPEVREVISYPGGHQEGFPDTFKQCFRAFYEAIRSGKPVAGGYPTFVDGHREIVLCEAILKSHRTRGWVRV